MNAGVDRIVKQVIDLPRSFRQRGAASIYAWLDGTGYFVAHEKITEALLHQELLDNPESVAEWLTWSESKRADSGWFLRRTAKGYDVGFFPASRDHHQAIAYTDPAAACAAFIKREIEDIRTDGSVRLEQPMRGGSLGSPRSVTFSGAMLRIGDTTLSMPCDVKEAFVLGDKVIVLLDPDACLGGSEPFRNLLALNFSGNRVWTAELPTDKPTDVFTRIVSRAPLRADSFSSFECSIDPSNGRLLAAGFFK